MTPMTGYPYASPVDNPKARLIELQRKFGDHLSLERNRQELAEEVSIETIP